MGDLGNQAEEGARGGVEERGKESPEDHPGAGSSLGRGPAAVQST